MKENRNMKNSIWHKLNYKFILGSILVRFAYLLPDKLYLRWYFRLRVGHKLNLKNPRTYNEKLQWLKINDRQSKYSRMVDKYEVKQFVASIIGDKYVIPTLGIWNSVREIDFNKLPNQFVIKCTHDSGGVIVCKDKSNFDIKRAKRNLSKWLNKNYYYRNREWPYRNVNPRIIAEKYMVDESGIELKDYKIFCFDGVPRMIEVDFDRFTEHKRNIYDTNWNLQKFSIQYPNDKTRIIERPKELEKMIELASILSANIPHVRVDLYNVSGEIYFGELTFYHGSGCENFIPEYWNKIFGEWVELPIGVK